MIDIAKKAALLAGDITLSILKNTIQYKNKGTSDNITTKADNISETVILETLKSKFSKHNYLPEETVMENNNPDYCWFIYPIDRTGN